MRLYVAAGPLTFICGALPLASVVINTQNVNRRRALAATGIENSVVAEGIAVSVASTNLVTAIRT